MAVGLDTTIGIVACLIVFPALTAYAAATDLLRMTISNRLCLALIIAFTGLALWVGLPGQQWLMHLAAAALVLVVCFGFFAAGWMGGGDAKLATATALWFGFEPLLNYAVLASFLGGMLTMLLLQMRGAPLPSFMLSWPWAVRLHGAKTGIPYGLALAPAALFVLPDTDIWRLALIGTVA
jgi:prepilin peptidase CpaA